MLSFFFFFNDTATTEIYTLSLHDALPIFARRLDRVDADRGRDRPRRVRRQVADRKSTRLNSSHSQISYAVFCLKKKKKGYLSPICPRQKCVLECARLRTAEGLWWKSSSSV